MKGNNAIYIIGLGARTPVGVSAATTAAAVRAKINRLARHPYMIDQTGAPMVVSRARYLPEDLEGFERFSGLAIPAALEALMPLQQFASALPPTPLFIGLPAQRPGLPEKLAEKIANAFKNLADMPARFSEISTIACGHAAGLLAIEAAVRKIYTGEAEICLAGGVESYLEPETLEWLDAEEQLHSDQNNWGFAPGEAAGLCLLSSRGAALKYHLSTSCQMLAIASAREKNVIKTDTVCTGAGLSAAFQSVLQSLDLNKEKINRIICDMNGERYRADEFGFTIVRTAEYFVEPGNFWAPADCWGDVGAASGPLFVSLACYAARRGYSNGTLNLLWTSSETGERSAAVVRSAKETTR
jgi:3-oxoacyl-[acyl-carrier-protein] synthase-1